MDIKQAPNWEAIQDAERFVELGQQNFASGVAMRDAAIAALPGAKTIRYFRNPENELIRFAG